MRKSQFLLLGTKAGESVLKELKETTRPIQIQIQGFPLKQGRTIGVSDKRVMFTLPFLQRFEGEHEATISFSLPPEVYFLKTKVIGSVNGYEFFAKEIYKLQRRDSFRLSIAESVQSKVSFQGLHRKYKLRDISQGGFSIEIHSDERADFEKGWSVRTNIEIGSEQFANLLSDVKHIRSSKNEKDRLIVGFQFLKLSHKNEVRLFQLITDIARTHFRHNS